MRPRILFLAPQPFFQLRGMCLAQRDCLTALGRLGAHTDVLCPPGGHDVRLEGARVVRLPVLPFFSDVPIGPSWAKLAYGLLMLPRAAWMLASGRYAFIHACEESMFSAALLKLLFRFRLVYDMDDVLTRRLAASGVVRWGPALAFLRVIERWMIRSADLVLTNSLETTDYARSVAGGERVFFYDHFPPPARPLGGGSTRSARRLRRVLGLESRPMVLYAGNLEAYQGLDLLIDAMPALLVRRPRPCLVVVGGRPRQAERLFQRARALGAERDVRFLGERSLRSAFGLMAAADVLVSPMTEIKAVPMKLYAYLASGRPIVATSLPNHEQLLSSETAILVEPRPESLADGLRRAIEDRSLADRLGRAAAALGESRRRHGGCGPALTRAYALLGWESASWPCASVASRRPSIAAL